MQDSELKPIKLNDVEYFLGKIPYMKRKHTLAHGLTGELARAI